MNKTELKIVENPTKKEHGFEIIKMSLLQLQVCSPLPVEEIESAVNRYSPSGTSNGWIVDKEGALAPVRCADDKAQWHYMFHC